jgi:adenosine deaminase/adenosine deaminase CECR1
VLRSATRATLLLTCLIGLRGGLADERDTAKVYEQLRPGPAQDAFFQAFPKGGDLHNHMGGGIYPEQWIEVAVKRKFCVDEHRLLLLENQAPVCPGGTVAAATLRTRDPFYKGFVDVMTLRGKPKPHDYFFQQGFSHVQMRIPGPVWADELEAVVLHAYQQNLTYLELQLTPFGAVESAKLAALLPAGGGLTEWWQTLEKSPVFRDMAASISRTITSIDSEVVKRRPKEAAALRRRYIISVVRGAPRERVFSQLAIAAELARANPLVVALNLVGAEDSQISVRDFRLHMQMVDFVRSRRPGVRITLHAGEMTPQILGAAPGKVPEALTYHIAESVRNGHAERIGHGTALRYEADRVALLREMQTRGILAEICLTSEELIQELKAEEIPFEAYHLAGVPVSLNTDDEGIFRSDLSHEFLRAARDYHLSYATLKELARNSIEYSFLPGQSLFRARNFKERVPECAQGAPACRAYLDANPKAGVEQQLEEQFHQFESAGSLKRFR